MAMTPLPTPPDPSDPTTFSARANAFCNALLLFQTEANALSSTAVTLSGGVMSGTLGFAAGSVSLPAGYQGGDTNTGFFFPTLDQFAITVGGAEKIRISSVGVQISNGVAGGFSLAGTLHVRDGGFTTKILSESLVTNGSANLTAQAAVASILMGANGNVIGGTFAGISQNNMASLVSSSAATLMIGTIGASSIVAFCVNSAEVARFNTGGELQIGSTTDQGAFLLQVNSQIWATNATISTSDATTKDELPIEDRRAFLKRISGVPARHYIRNDASRADGSRYGYFAQDFVPIFGLGTGIVRRLNSGLLALDEGAIHTVKIMALEERVSALEGSL